MTKILVVDDDEDIVTLLETVLPNGTFTLHLEPNPDLALRTIDRFLPDLVLLDLEMPSRIYVGVGRTAGGLLLTEIKRAHPDLPVLIWSTRLARQDVEFEQFDVQPDAMIFKPSPAEPQWGADFMATTNEVMEDSKRRSRPNLDLPFVVGSTPRMMEIARRIPAAVRAGGPVLLLGDSGTGKELVAQAIYQERTRHFPGTRLVVINAGNLTETLGVAELLGHERGAFTGATTQNPGLLREANGGTLFIDEVADLNAAAQTALLRVIEQGTFRPLGSGHDTHVNLFVIAATCKDLTAEIEARRFRADLEYRLRNTTLTLPPLRERLGDLPALFERFVNEANEKQGRHVRPMLRDETRRKLEGYSWPGNIRELQNAIRAAVSRNRGMILMPNDIELPEDAATQSDATSPSHITPNAVPALEAGVSARLSALYAAPIERRYALLKRDEDPKELLTALARHVAAQHGRRPDHKQLAQLLHPTGSTAAMQKTIDDKIRKFVSVHITLTDPAIYSPGASVQL